MRVLLLVMLLLAFAPAQAQPETDRVCEMTLAHGEAFNENNLLLLRLMQAVNPAQSPLTPNEVFNTYYPVLQSMRQYHEDIHADLPECALEANLAYLATITSGQDAVALTLARSAIEDRGPVYANRLEDARADLLENWRALSDALDARNFVFEGEETGEQA